MQLWDSVDEALNRHWAIAAISSEKRDEAIAYAESAVGGPRRAVLSDIPTPDSIEELASAYEFAAREWLDPDGLGNPRVQATEEMLAERWLHLEHGAARAFVLFAALPIPERQEGIHYRTLLLSALAVVAKRQPEFQRWLMDRNASDAEPDIAERWDYSLLARVVELWTEVLRRTDASALDRAMEIVATIREERPGREVELLNSLDEVSRAQMRFFLFALLSLTEAGTDLLLYRLRGADPEIRESLYMRLLLAREAVSGDQRLHSALPWLQEAAIRIADRSTTQLDLLADD